MRVPLLPLRRLDGPRPELVVVCWAAFTVGYFIFRGQCGDTLEASQLGRMWWLPPAAFAWLAWLHHRTAGRTSPLAALAFVLGGPVLGVCLLVPRAITEHRQFESAGVVQNVGAADALVFVHTVGCIALLCASTAALLHAALTYHEWVAAHIVFRPADVSDPPNQQAPFFLAELGLDRSSSLADLERAYRDRAHNVHPDRGGTDDDFKRLHACYERAREYLGKRAPDRPDPLPVR